MKKILLLVLIILVQVPELIGQDGPGGTEVWPGTNIYYGTKSNRVDGGGQPTWDFYNMTTNPNWESNSYIDYVYNYFSWNFPVNFRLKYPVDYDQNDPNTKYPIHIFFHGAGEGGIEWAGYEPDDPRYLNNDHQLYHGGRKMRDWINNKSFDGFALFVQYLSSWGNFLDATVVLTDSLANHLHIDRNKIYCHGLSGGGTAVYTALMNYPKFFAAGTPFSGRGSWNDSDNETLKHIPIWDFQGGLDDNPSPFTKEQYLSSMESVKEQSFYRTNDLNPEDNDQYDPPLPYEGRSIYTIFPNTGHGTWNPAWNQPKYLDWLLAQDKRIPHVFSDERTFCDGTPFTVKMGLTPGFDGYEWRVERLDNPGVFEIITDDAEYDLTLGGSELTIHGDGLGSGYGKYSVRFARGTEWTDWIDPSRGVEIGPKPASVPSVISADGSTALPALDGSTSVTLVSTTSDGQTNYANYRWFRDGVQIQNGSSNEIIVSTAGSYQVRVTEENDGCESDFSNTIIVTVNGVSGLSAPQNFTVKTQSELSILISWSDLSGETGYEIYRALNSAGPYELITVLSADTENYLDDFLTPGEEYFYRMRGFNNNGGGNYTPVENDQTIVDNEAPTAPVNLKLLSRTDNSISMEWEPSSDNVFVDHYLVYAFIDGVEIGGSPQETSNLNYDYSGLANNTRYNFKVTAIDLAGNESVFSNQITGITAEQGLNYRYYTFTHTMNAVDEIDDYPGLFTLVGPDPGITDRFRLDAYASWDNPKFAYDFFGYLEIADAGSYTFYTTTDDGSELYLDTDNNGLTDNYSRIVNNDGRHGCNEQSGSIYLTPGFYPIRVLYFENGGGECLSVEYNGPGFNRMVIPPSRLFLNPDQDLLSPPPPPTAPLLLGVTATSYDKIRIDWQDLSNDEDGFEIYRSSSSNPFVVIYTTTAGADFYDDIDLLPSTTYSYKIKAINEIGESVFSNELSATTNPAPPAPNAPESLQLTVQSYDLIDLQWTHNVIGGTGDPMKFYIYQSISDNLNYQLIDSVNAAVFTYSAEDLTPETTYYFQVSAANYGGESARSTEQSESTGAIPNTPEPAESLVATPVTFSSIQLNWFHDTDDPNTHDPPTEFIVERSLDGTNFIEIIRIDAANFSYVDVGLTSNTEYFYRILAYNGSLTNAPYSNTDNATTPADLPAAPSNLFGTDLGGSVQLDWTRNSTNENGFEIERKDILADTWNQIGTTSANITTFVDIDPNPGTNFYRVRAFNNDGNSPYSEELRYAISDFTILFNFCEDIDAGNSDAPWNDIFWNNSLGTTTVPSTVVDDGNNATSFSVSILNGDFTNGTRSGNTDESLSAYPFWVQETVTTLNSGNTVTLRFSGLDQTKFYKFLIYADNVASGNTRYQIGSKYIEFNATGNELIYPLDSIVCDVNGNIDFQIIPLGSQWAVLGLLELQAFTPENGDFFPTSPSADLSLLASWEDNESNTPISFNLANQNYRIQEDFTISNALSIPGINSKLIVENNAHVQANASLDCMVDIMDNSVLSLNDVSIPLFDQISASSTTIFTNASSIPAGSFGNITVNGTGTKVFDQDTVRILGDLQIEDELIIEGHSAGSSVLEIWGDLVLNGNVQLQDNSDPDKQISMFFNSNQLQNVDLNGNNLNLDSLQISGNGTVLVIDSVGQSGSINIGNTSGGGLIVNNFSEFHLNDHTLSMLGASTINENGELGEFVVDGATLNFETTSSTNSNLIFSNLYNKVKAINLLPGQGSGNVDLLSKVEVLDHVQLDAGTLNSSGNLVLVSSNKKTANLNTMGNGATLIGDIEIQRNVTRDINEGYFIFLGPSIKGQSIESLDDDFWVQGVTGGQFPTSWTNVSTYDESTNQWVRFQDMNDNVTPGTGVSAFIFPSSYNDMGGGLGEINVDYFGTPVIGDGSDNNNTAGEAFNFNITYSGGLDNGWNLVANPYPSDIDWDAVSGWTKTNIGAIYIFDGVNGRYISRQAGVGDFDGMIASGQGFWVKAENANPVLTMTEEVKTSSGASFYRQAAITDVLKISAINPEGKYDNAFIRLLDASSDNFDSEFDAKKLEGYHVNLSTISDDEFDLAINSLPIAGENKSIKVNLKTNNPGEYALEFEEIEQLISVSRIMLIDHYTGTESIVESGLKYEFSITSDERSQGSERFEIVLEPKKNSHLKLSGRFKYPQKYKPKDLEIEFSGDSVFILPVKNREDFEIKLKANSHYRLEAKSNNLDAKMGLSIRDILSMLFHLNGRLPFTEQYQYIAADVDENGLIDRSDLREMLNVMIGRSSGFSSNRTWKYLSEDLVSGYNIAGSPYLDISTQNTDDSVSFIGIKLGDLDNRSYGKREESISSKVDVYLEDRIVQSNEQFSLPLNISNLENVAGLQLQLGWDSELLELVDVKSVIGTTNFKILSGQELGKLDIVWISEPDQNSVDSEIINLIFKASEIKGLKRTQLYLSNSDEYGSYALNESLDQLKISFDKSNITIDNGELNSISLLRFYPNPISDKMNIQFVSSKSQEINLNIYNINGIIVDSFDFSASEGINELAWENKNNLKEGLYYFIIKDDQISYPVKFLVQY